MIISPVISTITTTLFFFSLVKLFDTGGDGTKALNGIISLLLPVLLLIGFSTSCGIYMLTPIQER
jgi:hypothetical protein